MKKKIISEQSAFVFAGEDSRGQAAAPATPVQSTAVPPAGGRSANKQIGSSPKQKKKKSELISAAPDKTAAAIDSVCSSHLPTTIVTAVEVIPALDLDVGVFEKQLAAISDPELRLRNEVEWLILMRRKFEGGLKILSTRDGIILHWVRSVAPPKEFGVCVHKYFPGLPERTRTYCMALSREFFKARGIKLDEAGTPEYFLELRDAWPLSRIILAAQTRQIKSAQPKSAPSGTISAAKSEAEPNRRSAFVRLKSCCVRLVRLDKACKNTLYSCKRLNPADRTVVAKFINNKLSEHLRPVFLDAVCCETVEDPAALI